MITNSNTRTELPGISLIAEAFSFPVSDMTITGNVDGDGLVWHVVATFDNPLDAPVEAALTLPLPNGGAVVRMGMQIGDRVIEADIKEREAARIEYEEAKDQGFTAALFEQDRAEIFNISVGNIHPNESISVVIEVHDRIAIDGSEASLRMPTMIKPRYTPEGVPDAAAINPPRVSAPAPLQATVTINFAGDATDAVCETVPSAVVTPRMVTINDFDLTCDIIVRWTIPTAIAQAKWVADSDNPEVGTLEVNIRVPDKKDKPRRRKAIQIMFDRSGSMSHHYLEWARRISMDVIGSLADDDLIHVLTFDSVIEVLGPTEHGFIRATRPVKKALQEQLLKITARGGTNLTEAIQAGGAALALLNDLEDTEAIDRVALLISDGAYGDEASAVYHRENDLGGSRVISVAIGENANGFLEQLSANGVCVYVSSEAGLSEASDKVMSRVATAAYSKAQLLTSGLTQQAPRHAPDIYPDVLVTLSGRMPRPKEGESVEVIALGEHVVTLPIAISQDSSTTTRWASQYIKSLDYGMMSSDFSAEGIEHHDSLEAEIVAMSIKYRVLCKYTAWLAVDRSRSTEEVIVRKLVQPQIEYIANPSLYSVMRHSTISPMRVGWELSGLMTSSTSSPHNPFIGQDTYETMAELKSISSITLSPKSEFPDEVLALIVEIDQYLSAHMFDDRDRLLRNIRSAILVLLSKFTKQIIGKRLSTELESALQSVMINVKSHTDQTHLVLTNLRVSLSDHSAVKKIKPQRRR
jgi:Ca-activated chloride channel family protein